MADRNTAWLRPLALCTETLGQANNSVVDVRNGPDIICSRDFLQLAIDSDWLLLLEELNISKESCDFAQANQHLRAFLKTLSDSKTA
ncbi:MAG: hypothetical protein AAGE59_09610 [Cyanobacteria bacterium P01_F01_bin.86]